MIYPYYSQTPIHILTDEDQRHAGPPDFVYHTRSKPLPAKSLVKIADDTYSVTLELRLMQLASEIELHELIKVAYELCGTYTLVPDSQYRHGGYGLPKPELNYSIYPKVHDRPYTSQRCYSCDLYWTKNKLAVEYDSNDATNFQLSRI